MIGYFVRHPVAANLLMILICILGIAVVSDLERETFPEFDADSVSVTVIYPGASALDVDDAIEIRKAADARQRILERIADFIIDIEGRGAGIDHCHRNAVGIELR
ncbi:MAG: efflux RND transporter permease subunit, partial [Pseudomonadota bacterium]